MTLDGEELRIPNEEKKLTVLLFFGPAHEILLNAINEMIVSESFIDKGVQFVGIYQGNETDARKFYETQLLPFPVVGDPLGQFQREYRIFSSMSGGVLALDRKSIVRLYNIGLLRSEFLKDFLNRYAFK